MKSAITVNYTTAVHLKGTPSHRVCEAVGTILRGETKKISFEQDEIQRQLAKSEPETEKRKFLVTFSR